jgi:hypothetical protein
MLAQYPMKLFIISSLIVIAGVGGWALLSMQPVESEAVVDQPVREMTQEAMRVATPRPAVAESNETEGKSSPAVMGTGSGAGSMATPLQPISTPRLSATPGVALGSGSKSDGAKVSDTTEIPSAAYALDDGSSIGGGYSGGMAREISIQVPEGAKVPAVFFDGEEKPMAQQKALDRIAEEFEQNVSEVPAGMKKEEVWEAARLISDERYLTLFGYQAYNQYHIQAAREALKEKRANSKAP